MDLTDVLDLYAVAGPDRAACTALIGGTTGPDPAVEDVLTLLRNRLGTFPDKPPTWQVDEPAVIAAFLRFGPEIAGWHERQGIDRAVTRATLADVGRVLEINRRQHGCFGMDKWAWITAHLSGGLFQLGRLQYLLHRQPVAVPPAVRQGEWVVGIHIPATGPLLVEEVDDSLAQVRRFLDRHFAQHGVRMATCESWLLDPYLLRHLPPTSNIASFARRFALGADPVDAPEDAVYFTFRTTDPDRLDGLPRDTTLQRVVLDRVAEGGTWQRGIGHLCLPGPVTAGRHRTFRAI